MSVHVHVCDSVLVKKCVCVQCNCVCVCVCVCVVREGGREGGREGERVSYLDRHNFDIPNVSSQLYHRLHLSNSRLYRLIYQVWPVKV